MTEWLVKRFVKNSDEIHRTEVRFSYARLSALTGVACNLLLAAVKLGAGAVSGSSAVTADAVNNLSDCISCILTLFGSRMAARPADEKHPFGHGRLEYLISLAAAGMIFLAAAELLKKGIQQIMNPSAVSVTPAVLVIMAATILVKIWMYRFNLKLGRKLDHTGMIAAGEDSRNDVITTSLTIFSLWLSRTMPSVPWDGIMTVIVSVYIIREGIELAGEIVTKLIGSEVPDELKEQILNEIHNSKDVFGTHDLIIHDYGPGARMGTVHVELPGNLSLKEAHEIIDALEKKIEERYHVQMTIHPDPAELEENSLKWKQETERCLKEITEDAAIHDFHLEQTDGKTVLSMDIHLPYQCGFTNEELRRRLLCSLKQTMPAGQETGLELELKFDRGYFSERIG